MLRRPTPNAGGNEQGEGAERHCDGYREDPGGVQILPGADFRAESRTSRLATLRRLRIAPVLAGSRGQPAADLDAIAGAITGLSRLACDLGDALEALDINPLICTPAGPVAVDALLIARTPT